MLWREIAVDEASVGVVLRRVETVGHGRMLGHGAAEGVRVRQHPQHIGAVRQCGFIAGIDILENAVTGTPWPATRRMGAAICQAARACGLLTRPVRDTLVLMPPLCTTRAQLDRAVAALSQAIRDTVTRA